MKKKNILLSGSIIFFLLYFMTISLIFPVYEMSFKFNYLNNAQIVNYTKTLLIHNNVPKENVRLWLEYVQKYNSKNKHFRKKTSNGWGKMHLSEYKKIHFEENLNGWTDAELYSLDLNCRISTFILIKDMVSSKYFKKEYDSSIENEIKKMNDIFGEIFATKDYITYRSLFTPIKLNILISKDVNIYDETLKSLKNYWEKEHLIFKKDNNASLIQAVLINVEDKTVELAHVGLLIKTNDMLCFIEKKNPTYPYQISIFKNYDDLNYYILHLFKKFDDCKSAKLMILQNDESIFMHDI